MPMINPVSLYICTMFFIAGLSSQHPIAIRFGDGVQSLVVDAKMKVQVSLCD